jgi:hypothetical protein
MLKYSEQHPCNLLLKGLGDQTDFKKLAKKDTVLRQNKYATGFEMFKGFSEFIHKK